MNIGDAVSRDTLQSSLKEVVRGSSEGISDKNIGGKVESPKSLELRVSIDRDREVKKIELEGIDKAVDSLNKDLRPINTKLEFSIHEKTNRVLVKIVDNDTDEIVKEIPPEKLVDIKANLLEAAGILIDSKA